MKNYKVKSNETLVKIAIDHGFKTVDAILDANSDTWPYLESHQYALMEGMTIKIPDKKAKQVDQASGTSVVYTAKKKAEQHLTLKLHDPYGEIKSVMDDVQLIINGGKVPIKDLTNYDVLPVDYKIISTVNPLPDGEIKNSSLKIIRTSVFDGGTTPTEIKLTVGGLDPLLDPGAGYGGNPSDNKSLKIAVQKLLTNLGYYNKELDGDLDKPESSYALSRFQSDVLQMTPDNPEYGKPGPGTCGMLAINYGIPLGPVTPIKYEQ